MRRNRRLQRLFRIPLLVVVLSVGFDVSAQTPPTPTVTPKPSLEKEFFQNILKDQKAIWTAPFHLERDDAKWMIPSVVGMGALITTDRITGDEIGEFDHLEKPSRIVSYPGSIYGVAAVAATFYFVSRRNNDGRARETGILSALAASDSMIVVSALKGISQRGRPQSGRERSEFFEGGSSFPSGHSIAAWSVATVVANEYHDHPVVPIAAYGIASAVSVARFTGGKHYLSDILVGSALGFGIGKYVYHAHHREELDSSGEAEKVNEAKWPAITPRYSRRAREYGVRLTWSF